MADRFQPDLLHSPLVYSVPRAMPINLTTVPEGGGGGVQRSRRRRHRNRVRRHLILAIGGGVALFLILGLCLLLTQNVSPWGRSGLAGNDGKPGTVMPGDPIPAEQVGALPTVISSAALDTGELPEAKAKAKVLSVRRVRGADNTDSLQVEYDFLKNAGSPTSYVIAVRTPARIGRVAFTANSANHDVVVMSAVLNRLGSQGPIDVWIETIFPANDRVSNVMSLP
jgi:hypothetical protein